MKTLLLLVTLVAAVLAGCKDITGGGRRSPNAPVAVSAGERHTCALTTGGAAYCWGDNAEGQLGTDTPSVSPVPVRVAGGVEFASLSVGGNTSCALTRAGSAYCWGQGSHGQLGNGATSGSRTPVPVSGGLTFSELSSGAVFNCGRVTGGGTYCWGHNVLGQLGTGSTTESATPVPVVGNPGLASVSPTRGNILFGFTCGLTASGAAFCWGANDQGQLGAPSTQSCTFANNTLPCTLTPAPVSGGVAFTAITAGRRHTCAVGGDRRVYCWGANDSGQLGTGTSGNSPVPVRVAGVLGGA